MKPRDLLTRLQFNTQNVKFKDLTRLAEALGFRLDRVRGSHHIYLHPQHVEAQLNLQPDRGEAKAYQVAVP